MATKRFPILPARPERICWGCDKYCAADSMACGNGSDRTPHPAELFGDDWYEWTPPREGEQEHPGAAASLPDMTRDPSAAP